MKTRTGIASFIAVCCAVLAAGCSKSSTPAKTCTAGGSCTPTNACHTGTISCSTGSPVCTDSNTNVSDGTACGGSSVCTAGVCGAAASCTPNQACTPSGTADPCKSYVTSCSSPTATATCAAGANKSDGTACGGSNVCKAGVCGAATRTVSGTIQTIFVKDDQTTTTVPGAPPENPVTISGILVADGSAAGYTTLPVTVDASFHFSVPNVPVGTYYLQVDSPNFVPQGTGQIAVISRTLYQLTTSTPDLSIRVAGRADRTPQTKTPTNLTLNVTDTVPWVSGDSLLLASSQGSVYNRPSRVIKPAAGATSITGTYDWQQASTTSPAYLPDASKGDVTWVYHRSTISLGTGPSATPYHFASEFLKRTDFTVADGTGATLTATLAAAPQTGTLSGNWLNSKFAALSTQVNPAAVPTTAIPGGPSVFAQPYTLTYPNQPLSPNTPLAYYLTPDSTTDTSYGTLHYGQFLDTLWKEWVQAIYSYDLTLTAPGGPSVPVYPTYFAGLAIASAPASWQPTLSPPTAPKINGADAFTTHIGATSTPTISWSAPTTGTATRYIVSITNQGTLAAGDVQSLSVNVYSATSFKVPGNFLKSGVYYSGAVTAVNSPEVLDGPIFGAGLPFTYHECDFGLFTP